MIFKMIGLIMIFSACAAGGILYGNKFKKREEELMKLERRIMDLENKIIYTMEPLPEALNEIAIIEDDIIDTIFKECSRLLLNNEVFSVEEAFNQTLTQYREHTYLKREDIEIIMNMSRSLGTMDEEGHKKMFKSCLEILKRTINEAHIESLKNTKMYKSIGISLGLAIVIILI